MKNNNRKKLKGFTLIELVVVVAVFGLLIAATLTFIAPVMNIHRDTVQYSESAAVVDNVRRTIEDNLRFANRMDVYVGPDIGMSETAFIENSVEQLRNDFIFEETTDKKRVTHFNDIVYVMKINNPETFKDISSTAEEPGKISIWRYDNGVLNAASSKEWAVSQALYNEYAFSLSFGITYNTSMKTVAGQKRELIDSAVYDSYGDFVSPSNFNLVLDIYGIDYANRANTASSDYTLCKTNVSNSVALSFVNMTSSASLTNEEVCYIDKTATPQIEKIEDVVRYSYNPRPAGSVSNDIYFVYTVPNLA